MQRFYTELKIAACRYSTKPYYVSTSFRRTTPMRGCKGVCQQGLDCIICIMSSFLPMTTPKANKNLTPYSVGISLYSLASVTKTVFLFCRFRIVRTTECTLTTPLTRDTLAFAVGVTEEVVTIVTSNFVTFVNVTQYFNTSR